jgi:eukaryotic-like serine/threonine-protein kinase
MQRDGLKERIAAPLRPEEGTRISGPAPAPVDAAEPAWGTGVISLDESRATTAASFSEDHLAVQRLTRLGMVAWPAFVLLDLYMVFLVHPGAPLWPFLTYRIVGEVMMVGLLSFSSSPATSLSLLRTLNGCMATACSALISLMALHIGGISSAYLHGISIVIMVQSIMVPAPWRQILKIAAPCALSFPCVVGLAMVTGVDQLGASAHLLASFFANYTFVLGTVVVGAAAGHTVWAARMQLYQSRRLGRYRLEARIGEGGMNEVWLAWDQSLRRRVALKILRVLESTSARTVARFEREAHAMSQLSSPNTVRVFDFGASDDGVYYIAMEYLNGMDLAKLVRTVGPLPPERVVHLAVQACRSLTEAHSAGVIHRDIKPANLFVTRHGDEFDVIKVLDFGIAQHGSSSQTVHTRTIAGTPAFMAPEAWLSGHIDRRSDVYSLGATLYFLLTGETPFSHVAGGSLFAAHFSGTPLRPSALSRQPIPRELEEVVLRCLAKVPEHRYATAQDLSTALELSLQTTWTAEQARAAWHTQLGLTSMTRSGAGPASSTEPPQAGPTQSFVR